MNWLAEHIFDLERVQETFCEGCGAVVQVVGNPDETMCPAEFVPGAAGCIRRRDYDRVVEQIEEVATWLKS